MGLSIAEAIALTGRSRQTLWRWKRDGCDVTDEISLREFSDHADMRARGKAAQLVFDRPTSANLGASGFPGDARQALAALSTLGLLKDAFQRRLERVRGIGAEIEAGMIKEEIGYISESARFLAMLLEGYEL